MFYLRLERKINTNIIHFALRELQPVIINHFGINAGAFDGGPERGPVGAGSAAETGTA